MLAQGGLLVWTFQQATGYMLADSGKILARGYAGNGSGKNNPSLQNSSFEGPIPQGSYVINSPRDTERHGPYVLWLTPDPANKMFGRDAFGIHGDSKTLPGTASDGCIIMPLFARERIWESGDHTLQVTSGMMVVLDPEILA